MAPLNIKALLGRDDQAFTPHTHPANPQLLSDCLAHLKASPNKHDAMRVSTYLDGLKGGGLSGTKIAEELRSEATKIVQKEDSPKKADANKQPGADTVRRAGEDARAAASPISRDAGFGRAGK